MGDRAVLAGISVEEVPHSFAAAGVAQLLRALASIWRMRSLVTCELLATSPGCGCGRPRCRSAGAAPFPPGGVRCSARHELPLQQGEGGGLGGLRGVLVRDEIAQMAVLLLADGSLQADGLWAILRMSRTLSGCMFMTLAMSSAVGSWPSSCSSCRETRMTL
jgi:hypothetical protein